MTVSLEALAMAGADYLEWGVDAEQWMRQDLLEMLPPHLLAEGEDEEFTTHVKYGFSTGDRFDLKKNNDTNGAAGDRYLEMGTNWRTVVERVLKSLRPSGRILEAIVRLLGIKIRKTRDFSPHKHH